MYARTRAGTRSAGARVSFIEKTCFLVSTVAQILEGSRLQVATKHFNYCFHCFQQKH